MANTSDTGRARRGDDQLRTAAAPAGGAHMRMLRGTPASTAPAAVAVSCPAVMGWDLRAAS